MMIEKHNGFKVYTYNHEPTNDDKALTEREWRDSELDRTDKFVVLPDSPKDYTAYRLALREYPQQPDFPNGARPNE